jgi:predicted ferric reductase
VGFQVTLKNAHPYIEYDSANDKIKYKNNRKPCWKIFAVLYMILLLPVISLMSYNELIQCGMKWLVVILIIISIPCTIVAIYFLFKAGDIGQAIKLMKILEEDHT